MNDFQTTEQIAQYWDVEARDFDEEPDHGLRDLKIRAEWEKLLLLLPIIFKALR